MSSSNVVNPNIRNKDLLALRGYITANDATQYDHVHESTVLLDLTHSNLLQRHIEIRFDKHDTLERLRQRIHQKTGTSPQFQHLQIKSAGQLLREIPPEHDDHYKLGYFGLGKCGSHEYIILKWLWPCHLFLLLYIILTSIYCTIQKSTMDWRCIAWT